MGTGLCLIGSPLFATTFIVNAGVTNSTAQTLNANESGTVAATGILTTAGARTVRLNGNNATVNNSGTIRETTNGRAIHDNTGGFTGLSITNQSIGLIQGNEGDAVKIGNSGITIDNFGTIVSLLNGQALDLDNIADKTNTVTNRAGGVVRSGATNGEAAIATGNGTIIDNYGTIEALKVGDDGSHAIDYNAHTGVSLIVRSTGIVDGGNHGITGEKASTITVENGGQLIGRHGSGVNIDSDNASGTGTPIVDNNYFTVTVTNSGLISGDYSATAGGPGDGDGVDVDELVAITNNSTGIIRGTGAAGNDANAQGNNTEGIAAGGGTINNYGSIYGETLTGDQTRKGRGIVMDNGIDGSALALTNIYNYSTGTIEGRDGAAIILRGSFGDRIENNAGGVIRGTGGETSVFMDGGIDVLINGGLIENVSVGGNTVDMGSDNDTLTNASTGVIKGSGPQVVQLGGGADIVSSAGSIEHTTGGTAIDLGSGADQLTFTGSAVVKGDIDGGSESDSLDISTAAPFAYEGTWSNIENASVASGSTLAVGFASSAAGILELENTTLSLLSGSTLSFDLFAGGSNDSVLVGGSSSLALAGILDLNLASGFSAQVNDWFQLTSGTGPTGQFSGLAEGAFLAEAGYSFQITYVGGSGNDVALRVAAVPEPSRAMLVLIGGLFFLARRRR